MTGMGACGAGILVFLSALRCGPCRSYGLALVLTLSASLAAAQQRVSLDQFRTCQNCSIEPVLDLQLGDASGLGVIESEASHVVFDERRRRYGVYFVGATRVLLFDQDGRLSRVIGQEGEGPGELRRLRAFAFGGDNIVLLDSRLRKWLVLTDGGELKFESRLTGESGPLIIVSRDTAIVAAMGRARDTAGYPLHLTAVSSGQVLRHFGSGTGELNAAAPYAHIVLIAGRPAERTVWIANPGRLRFEEWSMDGSLRRVVDGAPAWFPPVTEPRGLAQAPPTTLHAFAIDKQDRLWVASRVADRNWQAVVRRSSQNPEGAVFRSDYDAYWDLRLDMFDLRAGAHYGPLRWDGSWADLFTRGSEVVAARVEYTSQLVPRVALYRLETRDIRQ